MQELKHQQKSSGDVLSAVLMENACDMVSSRGAVRGSQAPWELPSEAEGNLSLHVSLPCHISFSLFPSPPNCSTCSTLGLPGTSPPGTGSHHLSKGHISGHPSANKIWLKQTRSSFSNPLTSLLKRLLDAQFLPAHLISCPSSSLIWLQITMQPLLAQRHFLCNCGERNHLFQSEQ